MAESHCNGASARADRMFLIMCLNIIDKLFPPLCQTTNFGVSITIATNGLDKNSP
jgi:hypothetical protein